ncbi:MAG: AAA family ATPase [Gammaproteobacteria bacterium]|jgi:general secretion pathway protein A
MYESYFGLKEKPFSIAPDPRYMYLSESHEEALAHLLFGLQQGGGFVQLTGEVGTGKTTLIRALLEQMPESVDLALVFNPKLSPLEFVAAICDELQVSYEQGTATLKTLTDALYDKLLENYNHGRRTVLIIDEAQALSVDVLEQVRLLTNLETTREKLLQIILIGQPELRSTLARDDMRQLAQRVTDVYHLEPLNQVEVRNYLIHRLTIAGARKLLYKDSAVKAIYRYSGGIPRIINEIADKALLAAYAKERTEADKPMVDQAAEQVLSSQQSQGKGGWLWGVAAAVVLLSGLAIAILLYPPLKSVFRSMIDDFSTEEVAVASAVKSPQEPIEPVAPMIVSNGVTLPYTEEAVRQIINTPQPVPEIVEPAPEPPSPDDLEAWLLSSPEATGRNAAFSEIYSAWQIDYSASSLTGPCDFGRDYGLQCLKLQGNWSRLMDINRPAVLQIRLSDRQEYHVALLGVDGQEVTLSHNGEPRVFERSQLDTFWFGDFEVLWQIPPSGYVNAIFPGERGQSVEWLRDRLQEITGDDIEPERSYDFFDQRLADIVRNFQTINRLEADAVVGVQTIIRLNSASPSDNGPRLRAKS